MGWRFDLKHLNTVAYITLPERREPPRLTKWQLLEFLGSFQGEYRERPPLISSDGGWIETVTRVAREASRWLKKQDIETDALLDAERIKHVLSDLRPLLGRYDLFGMPIGEWEEQKQLNAFAEHAAYSSEGHALFLIPDLPNPEDTLAILDPLPIAREVATRPDLWPGMLFWMPTGQAVFAPLDEAYGLYQRILEAFQAGTQKAAEIIESYNQETRESGAKRLLHLSDLHFGTSEALQNQAYLSAHLKTKFKSVNRIVITGDLFHNPRKSDALAFRNFRADLEAATGNDLIVIPGNHDQRIYGNKFWFFGTKLRELTKLEWSGLVVDNDLQCVFYCFDSSRDGGEFARGEISKEQQGEMATQFEVRAAARPVLRDYLSIALIHHHPYAFDAKRETLLQVGLARIGIPEEYFLRMNHADRFLSWCAGRRVPLILHGHKHVSRHVSDRIEWNHGKFPEQREVTAVGCGTSLGAEGFPLSYNILEWSPRTRKWSAAFFADPGHGTGFEEQYVALHSTKA